MFLLVYSSSRVILSSLDSCLDLSRAWKKLCLSDCEITEDFSPNLTFLIYFYRDNYTVIIYKGSICLSVYNMLGLHIYMLTDHWRKISVSQLTFRRQTCQTTIRKQRSRMRCPLFGNSLWQYLSSKCRFGWAPVNTVLSIIRSKSQSRKSIWALRSQTLIIKNC